MEKEVERSARRSADGRYKWVIVGLCFLTVMITLGFCSSPKSLFIGPISEAIGVDRSVYSVNDSLRYITTAVTNLFFGLFIMKFGEKKLMLAGIVSLICSSLCYALASGVAMLYLGGILLGFGFSFTSTTMVGYVIDKWSKNNKGTIMGLVLAANGVGGVISIQIISPIIEGGRDIPGYKLAYLVIAAVLSALAVIIALFFRRKKDSDGEEEETQTKRRNGRSWAGIEMSEAQKKWYFYAILAIMFFTGLSLQGISGIAPQHMRDVGMAPELVKGIMSLGSVTLALFKFSAGFAYDRFGLRATVTTCTVASMLAIFALIAVNSASVVTAAVYMILIHVALPLETVMIPIYASDLFGDRAYGKILGLFVSMNTAGFALGAPLVNLCYDLSGSYKTGFYVGIVIMLCVAVCLQFVISASNKTREKVRAEISGGQN